MHCIAVTESELKQIGLSNLLTTIFVGIGSALCAYGFDVDKDLYLADDMPKQVIEMAKIVSSLCWAFGIICFLAAAAMWFWRRDIIRQIKKESGQIKEKQGFLESIFKRHSK